MKKILPIIALSATIFLAGCGSSGQNMSFQDAYNKLTTLPKLESNNIPANSPLADTTNIDFAISSPQWFHASGTLVASWEYDMTSGAANINLLLQAKAYEPSFGASVKIDWDIKIANDTKSTYAYIDSFNLVPETGNVDGGLITALIGSISKKWINLGDNTVALDTGNSVSGASISTNNGLFAYSANMQTFLSRFQEGITKYPLLKETGKTKIDGKLAYNVAWNPEGVLGFVNYLLQDSKNLWNNITFSGSTLEEVVKGILESPLVGNIIVYSKDNVVLRVDSITTQDAWIISMTYSTKDGLTWTNTDNEKNIIATGDILPSGKEFVFHISIPANEISLIGETKAQGKNIVLTVTTPDVTLQATISNKTMKIDSFVPTIISGAMPLENIAQGFGLLWGSNTDSSEAMTQPIDEADISENQ